MEIYFVGALLSSVVNNMFGLVWFIYCVRQWEMLADGIRSLVHRCFLPNSMYRVIYLLGIKLKRAMKIIRPIIVKHWNVNLMLQYCSHDKPFCLLQYFFFQRYTMKKSIPNFWNFLETSEIWGQIQVLLIKVKIKFLSINFFIEIS